MRRLACTIVALSLGAACGPTKPSEVPPLAPRPDPGLPTQPSQVPGVPDPDKPPTGPSPEPGDGSEPATPQPISYEFRGAGGRIDPPARPGPGTGATPAPRQRPPDAGIPGDAGPVLPPLPDGGLTPDARRTAE